MTKLTCLASITFAFFFAACTDEGGPVEEQRAPLTDEFSEGDQYLAISALLSADATKVQFEVRHRGPGGEAAVIVGDRPIMDGDQLTPVGQELADLLNGADNGFLGKVRAELVERQPVDDIAIAFHAAELAIVNLPGVEGEYDGIGDILGCGPYTVCYWACVAGTEGWLVCGDNCSERYGC